MPWQYNGEHSIDFLVDDENHSKVNTWTDWYLVPKTRPVVNPPGLKSNIVDIPGANGSVDLTTALNGYPLYSDRSGQFEFILDNKYMNRYGPLSWGTVYTNIMTYLHGQKVKMWLTDDPDFFYQGRVVVNELKSEEQWTSFVFNYQMEPFKYENNDSTEPWLWDPFNFETGVIDFFEPQEVDGSLIVTIPARRSMPICPIIQVYNSEGISVEYLGISHPLHEGDNVIPYIIAREGVTTNIQLTGKATVSLLYRGGRL